MFVLGIDFKMMDPEERDDCDELNTERREKSVDDCNVMSCEK